MHGNGAREASLAILRQYLPALSDGRELPLSTSLRSLGLNSMRAVDLLLDLEDQLGITVPDSALTDENFETAGTLLALVVSLTDASDV